MSVVGLQPFVFVLQREAEEMVKEADLNKDGKVDYAGKSISLSFRLCLLFPESFDKVFVRACCMLVPLGMGIRRMYPFAP